MIINVTNFIWEELEKLLYALLSKKELPIDLNDLTLIFLSLKFVYCDLKKLKRRDFSFSLKKLRISH